MFARTKYWLTRRPVASALLGGIALFVLALLPARDISARPADVYGARRAPGAGEGPAAVSGLARVIDGDTIVIGGRHIRLEGIDAPEIGQKCGRQVYGAWACGRVAAEVLHALVAGRSVTCEARGDDRYGRMLGICFVDGHDINASMVRQGMAWAFVKYSRTYTREEAQARADRSGVWSGAAEPAWIYREQRWAGAQSGAPSGCSIKGDIVGREQLYHLPWSPHYDAVRVEAEKGERWFCSEAAAVAAGWHPAMAR